jgi:pimeloyl-ACP methyl ester carboxylesterase
VKKALLFYGGLILLVGAMGAYAYALSLESAWESSGFTKYPAVGKFVDAGGGRRLRLRCQGLGKPGIVLEASGLAGADQYEELLPEMARYTRICAYDRAGMGYSELSKTGDPKLADYTRDLELAAKEAGPPPWILVGASYGGVVVQAYARQHPENVGALMLLDAVVPEAFDVMQGPWSALDSALRKANLVAPVGLLRDKDPLKLGDTRDAWLAYKSSTWVAVRQLVATRAEAKELFAKAPPLPPDLPMRVLRHTKVGDMMGPDFPQEESEKLEPQWQKVQENFAAQSTQGKLVAVEGAGHLIVKDAMETVRNNLIELMHPASERAEKLAAPPDGGTPDAGN